MQRLLQMGIRREHSKRCAVLLETALENSLSELCLREHQKKQQKRRWRALRFTMAYTAQTTQSLMMEEDRLCRAGALQSVLSKSI